MATTRRRRRRRSSSSNSRADGHHGGLQDILHLPVAEKIGTLRTTDEFLRRAPKVPPITGDES